MNKIDWNLARAFLRTAQAGSLSAAARKLELTQPTLSRQIASLEADLGVLLFERVGKRLVLTETGSGLLAHVERMGDAADEMALAVSGSKQAIVGRVCISATDSIAAYVLPDILARVRAEVPDVTLVVVASNSISNLRQREADIAIRHIRPDDPDLVARLVRETTAHVYAAKDWVVRNGLPDAPGDIATGEIVAFDQVAQFVQHMAAMGFVVAEDGLRLVSENSVVVWEMVRRGLGVGVMLKNIADRTPDIVQLLPDLAPFRVPIWLVAHRELQTSRRIRLVYDILAEELARG